MPKGSKKRRALRKKEAAAAAAREKPENEASSMASSEENSTVMPTVVFPKRTVLPEKMLASEVLDLRRKDAEKGIKEDALPTEISSSVQSLNTAAPLETSQADKIDMVVEASVVAEPCIIELESQDEDDGLIMPIDVCDSEGNETKDATEDLQDDDGGSVMASEDDAFLVITDNAVKSLTTLPCDLGLNVAESLNAENEVFTSVDAAVDQRALEHKNDIAVETKQDLVTTKNWVALENQDEVFTNVGDAVDQSAVENKKDNSVETKQDFVFSKNRVALENQEIAALNVEVAPVEDAPVEDAPVEDAPVEDAPAKIEEAFQVVEAAVQNKKDAILEDVNENDAVVENPGNAALNVVDAPKKTEGAAQVDEGPKNQEAILEDVNEIYKNSFEATVEDKITAASEVDASEKTGDAVPVVDVEAVFAARPAVDAICQTHDAVSVVPATPEVVKQLKEIKEIVKDVLNRLSAIDALLN
ncbi:hypothetical protein POM88_006121 [Heracleum sosnowskyi]|uniref:Uncharacterized protein n=1 Tax=Heracleum sosnowskyi TaxID=360622 RepID=A0AAD8N677_9APIA|nr:hypothetical protein POM88_006121 [Heracleum sosnowskyi]